MLEQRDDALHGHPLPAQGRPAPSGRSSASRPTSPTPPSTCAPGCPPTCRSRVEVLQVKYPQGAEKMLITALLGREVPSGGLPLDVARAVRQRRHRRRDRPPAAPRPRHPGAGDHHHRPGGAAQGQLPHPDRHAAALRAGDGRRRRRRQPRLPRRADDGRRRCPASTSRSPRAPPASSRSPRPRPSGPTARSIPASAAATASMPARSSSTRRSWASWPRTASTSAWPTSTT